MALSICVALWAASVIPGLNAVGLVNWQESARALASSEMHARGDWVVPTIAGEPYLAKPPMLYWCHMGLSAAIGRPPGEHELRWTVALAGLAGVLLTYAAARSVLAHGVDHAEIQPEAGDRISRAAALWAAAFLATGVLHVRSSRIGELDILLTPFTLAAVWGAGWSWINVQAPAWRRSLVIAGATAACAGAALTKGPPALAVVALAVGGGIAAWSVVEHGRRLSRRTLAACGALGACLVITASLAIGPGSPASVSTWLAAGLVGIGGAALGVLVARGACTAAIKATLAGWWRSGLPISIVGGLVPLWAWTHAVESRLGPGTMGNAAAREASDNLHLFDPAAPIQNLEAFVYAAGVGSAACLAAVAWLMSKPIRLSRGWWIVVAWIGLGMLFFSVAGRGSGRYLTPLWPAVCILGGVWIARAVRDSRRGGMLAVAATIATVVLAAAQAWWYASSRAASEGTRSPRDFMSELLSKPGIDPRRLAVVDFWVGSLNYYADSPVEPVFDQGPWIDYPHRVSPVHEFVQRLRADGGEWVVLVRGAPSDDAIRPAQQAVLSPTEHLSSRGLALEEIPIGSVFRIDRNRTPVKAYRVHATSGGDDPSPGES